MSHEASKTRQIRPADFASTYLSGKVIDIGCGPDLIVPHAEPFDLVDGDAQRISDFRPKEAYDAVCSSHCLEHMPNPPEALLDWWRLVKPGGYMVLVVPDEDLYEQGIWPSLFNSDHKATFRLDKPSSWSPVSHDLRRLAATLPEAEILGITPQHQGYDPKLMLRKPARHVRLAYKLKLRALAVMQGVGLMRRPSQIQALNRLLFKWGIPVDQTAGPALAQFELIARKRMS